MTNNPSRGIPLGDFQALLKCAFDAGAKKRKTTQEAYDYPLNHPVYSPNILGLAKKWPDANCALALDCAYQAGQKAAVYAGSGQIELAHMQQACKDLEGIAKSTGKGPVCIPV